MKKYKVVSDRTAEVDASMNDAEVSDEVLRIDPIGIEVFGTTTPEEVAEMWCREESARCCESIAQGTVVFVVDVTEEAPGDWTVYRSVVSSETVTQYRARRLTAYSVSFVRSNFEGTVYSISPHRAVKDGVRLYWSEGVGERQEVVVYDLECDKESAGSSKKVRKVFYMTETKRPSLVDVFSSWDDLLRHERFLRELRGSSDNV